ncbi:MAG: C4-dicarboxylate ABC transporter substrate-binding protein [Hyphomicrobiales bacterium]|nr:MAG: C4-dicarboxylate ABC transporter substrate-binding protein [Hyphomicrobiales bacterium]
MSGVSDTVVIEPTGSNWFIRLAKTLSSISGVFSAVMILFAVIITCQMIFVRFVLNGSTIWQTEAVIYLMVAATLVGLPYVQRHRGHVNVDLIPLMLGPSIRRILAFVVLIASIIVISIMLFYGFEQWYVAFQKGWTTDTVWGVRLWIPYISLPIGFGLFLLQLVADLVAVITGYEKPFGLEDKS